MAISANTIVQVLPRILTGTGRDLVFNGLILSKNNLLPSKQVLSFATAEAVGEFFGLSSDEYQMAVTYFGGFSGSQIKPSELLMYRYTDTGAVAFLRGEELDPKAALATLKDINAGTFAMSLDGENISVDSLDFSGASSLSECASILKTAINGDDHNFNVIFTSLGNCFIVSGASASDDATASVASGTVADAMGLSGGAVLLSDGQGAKNATEIMTGLTAVNQNFVSFTTAFEPEDAEAIEIAKWASGQASAGTMYLFVLWDSDRTNLTATATEVISEKLKAENVGATTVIYNSPAYAAFVMGIGASVNWEAVNGTLTYAFKSQEGLGANVNDTQHSAALLKHGVNFIGNYATRNDNFVFLNDGSMLGDWLYIDNYLNACWLCNAMQVQILAGFKAVRRVPYTEAGFSMIRSWCRDVINRALVNGVIEAGVTLSETQKSTLIQELGADYSSEIFSNGYYLQVVEPSVNARQHRETPRCNLVYTYGGAVHKLTMPAIAVV